MSNDPTQIKKRSVNIAGHATSVSMEDAFWDQLTAIAKTRGTSVSGIVREIDETRTGNLSSALRVFVLENVQTTD